jgi:hypothetical protein
MTHGHVKPNPDGSKARCGGPGICPECAIELGLSIKEQRLKNTIELPQSKYEERFRVIANGTTMLASFSIYKMAEEYIWKMTDSFGDLRIEKVWALKNTAPRRWTSTEIATARRTGDDIGLPDDFVDSNAYDTVEAERDKLKAENKKLEHAIKQEIFNNDEFGCEFTYIVIAKRENAEMSEQLQRERRKVELLYTELNYYIMDCGRKQAEQKEIDEQIEAIDKGEEQ